MRLFIDMDGTLVTWQKAATEEELYSEGYFYNLPSQENVLQALQQLLKVYSPCLDVFILSCYLPDSAYALSEKRRWCLEHIPEIPERNHLFVPFVMKKEDFVPGKVHTDDVLLDDYTRNLLEWTGRGVKCLNGINHTRRTWKGPLIDIHWEPWKIANMLAMTCGI